MIQLRIAVAIFVLTLAGAVNAQFTTVINVPPDVAPDSIGSDTQLNLMDGGMLSGMPADPDNPNSTGIFEAGSPDGSSQNVELNITGGEAEFLDVHAGGILNMSGGTAFDFLVFDGATVNFSGGLLDSFEARSGSTVNVSGGTIGEPGVVGPRIAGNATISGGTFPARVEVQEGGVVLITGGSFEGPTDGLLNFGAFDALEGSEVVVEGGAFASLVARWDAVVTVTGGEIELLVLRDSGVEATISGGTFGNGIFVSSDVAISGGNFDGQFYVNPGLNVELIGTEFLIDENKIAGLTEPGDSVIINERGGALLSGTFLDGNPFNFTLNEVNGGFFTGGPDYFPFAAEVRLTLVPEPSACGLAVFALLLTGVRRSGKLSGERNAGA